MTEPLWHGRHGHGAMGRHKDDLRAEAEERQRVYDAKHPAVKLLTEIFTAPKLTEPTPEVAELLAINDPPKDNGAHRERQRRRRNVERKRKAAHTD